MKISNEAFFLRQPRTFAIAFTGLPGAGKTTISGLTRELIRNCLPNLTVVTYGQDSDEEGNVSLNAVNYEIPFFI